ncbi:hypothetical protein [Delftia lacustris]|uniref:hypothetical protein n=1 Tax=Delftia lacustris TaxID=558537 RepID=UPI0006403FEC|nr:hypothetical protein [Delftia lacustris]
MNEKLLAIADSLDAKADTAKEKAIADTYAASESGSNVAMMMAHVQAIRADIFREVAASLREAAH